MTGKEQIRNCYLRATMSKFEVASCRTVAARPLRSAGNGELLSRSDTCSITRLQNTNNTILYSTHHDSTRTDDPNSPRRYVRHSRRCPRAAARHRRTRSPLHDQSSTGDRTRGHNHSNDRRAPSCSHCPRCRSCSGPSCARHSPCPTRGRLRRTPHRAGPTGQRRKGTRCSRSARTRVSGRVCPSWTTWSGGTWCGVCSVRASLVRRAAEPRVSMGRGADAFEAGHSRSYPIGRKPRRRLQSLQGSASCVGSRLRLVRLREGRKDQ
jgi:hypothetical protein